jgi:hypothetical protein
MINIEVFQSLSCLAWRLEVPKLNMADWKTSIFENYIFEKILTIGGVEKLSC